MRTPTAVIGACAVLPATLAGHRLVPNVYSAGSLLDSVVPVLGVFVPVLAYRGLTATAADVIATPGSDHRAVRSGFAL